MPDRAILPLVCGGSAGFLCGLIASALEFAALTGAASTAGVQADERERLTVMAFRAALAAAFAVCLFFGMLTFLRDAKLLVAVVLFLVGGFFAYCLTQIRIRTRLS